MFIIHIESQIYIENKRIRKYYVKWTMSLFYLRNAWVLYKHFNVYSYDDERGRNAFICKYLQYNNNRFINYN